VLLKGWGCCNRKYHRGLVTQHYSLGQPRFHGATSRIVWARRDPDRRLNPHGLTATPMTTNACWGGAAATASRSRWSTQYRVLTGASAPFEVDLHHPRKAHAMPQRGHGSHRLFAAPSASYQHSRRQKAGCCWSKELATSASAMDHTALAEGHSLVIPRRHLDGRRAEFRNQPRMELRTVVRVAASSDRYGRQLACWMMRASRRPGIVD